MYDIATRAYGDPTKWPIIWKANSKTMRSTDPNLIYPGEVIFIPPDPTKQAVVQQAQANRYAKKPLLSATMVLDGLEVPVLNARLNRSVDTMADSFVCEIPWTSGLDAELDKRVAPFSYAPCQVYLGPNLALTGRVYNITAEKTDSGIRKTLECFTKTVDLIDSTVPPPYFYQAAYFDSIVKSVLPPFGLSASFPQGRGAYFEFGVEAKSSETAAKFLNRLAFQSGQIMANDVYGNLVFNTAKALSLLPPVGTLNESEPWGQNLKINFEGRTRFNVYKALGWEGDGAPVISIAKDPVVPVSRFVTFVVDDNDPGNTKTTAAWKRSKQLIKTLTIPIPLAGWYNPQGNLWAPGQMVNVISATLHCPNGFPFMIRETEHTMEDGGFACTLHLVPAQALTGEDLKEPWVVK